MKTTPHMDAVAIRKAGIEGWKPYQFQAVAGGFILTGGVPRQLKSGPHKGRDKWDGKGTPVIVTEDEINAEAARYAAETWNCSRCYGEGQVFASWHHIDGTKYRPCKDCGGTGKRAAIATTTPKQGDA